MNHRKTSFFFDPRNRQMCAQVTQSSPWSHSRGMRRLTSSANKFHTHKEIAIVTVCSTLTTPKTFKICFRHSKSQLNWCSPKKKILHRRKFHWKLFYGLLISVYQHDEARMVSNWLILIFPLTLVEAPKQQFFACSVVFLNFFQLLTVPRTRLDSEKKKIYS